MAGASRRALPVLVLLGACETSGADAVDATRAASTVDEAYGSEVVSFEPGPGAGFGKTQMPDIVLGAPKGAGDAAQSLDVVSLGKGGTIVLGFGGRVIADGPGADLVVFENAFFAGGDPALPFVDLAEVAVSEDGETWNAFPCDPAGGAPWTGCAGQTPVLPFDAANLPLDPEVTGGDAYDLATIGVERAAFLRIRDLGESAGAPSAGFDLDAVGVIHLAD